MQRLLPLFFIVLLLATATKPLQAQEKFKTEIADFKKKDSAQAPPKNAILFVGSSSFRYWTDVQTYFPGYTIINRGFGGSTLPDVIHYVKEVIYPYKAKQIVIYCGENDLAESDTVTAEMVFQRFQQLFTLIRKKQPGVSVVFVSLKPSPSRQHLFAKMIAANQLIQNYLAKRSKTAYVDVYSPMLVNGKPDGSLFKSDNLHMTPKGYAIWQKAIQPYLIK